jgi:hypothetical protein
MSELLPAADDDCTTTASGDSRPRHGREIAHQLVGFFAHHAAPLEVRQDTVQKIWVLQKLHRFVAIFLANLYFGLGWREGFSDLLALQFFQLQPHTAQVLADHVFLQSQFIGRLLDERDPLPGAVEIERIDVERFARCRQQIHFHQIVAQVLRQAADAIFPGALHHRDLVAVDLDGGSGG